MTEGRFWPANFGPLRGADGNARVTGPCGDTVEFWLRVENGRITQASFTTDGCGHSVLSGSAAARLAEEKTLEEWMDLHSEASGTYARAAWQARYDQRAVAFQYVHTYYTLRKPL